MIIPLNPRDILIPDTIVEVIISRKSTIKPKKENPQIIINLNNPWEKQFSREIFIPMNKYFLDIRYFFLQKVSN